MRLNSMNDHHYHHHHDETCSIRTTIWMMIDDDDVVDFGISTAISIIDIYNAILVVVGWLVGFWMGLSPIIDHDTMME